MWFGGSDPIGGLSIRDVVARVDEELGPRAIVTGN